MRLAALVVAALAAGCFKPDLADGTVTCGAAGECPSGMSCSSADNKCYAHPPGSDDMAMSGGDDLSSSDMAAMSCSINGDRLCADATHSAVCTSGRAIIDRACPPGSMCTGGHCAPPAGAQNCTSNRDCSGADVCDEYVVSNTFAGFCTAAIAGATGGINGICNAVGYDATCRTGVCAARDSGGTMRACLTPCTANSDCGGGGINCVAVLAPPLIEGASTAPLKFCIK
jgi:hypothetical protein